MMTYVFASRTPWPIDAMIERRHRLPGQWITIADRADLTSEFLKAAAPRYVFFPHWSWIVPEAILGSYECVCFHMTDVPFGRGGSPLQNLIVRGVRTTRLTALRMEAELDAGPVYGKRDLDLSGPARTILKRAAALTLDMIEWIVAEEPVPVLQSGDPTFFKRRRPEESVLPDAGTIEAVYDHIRMLDADCYPPAFLNHGGWRLELSEASLAGNAVEARVRIVRAGRSEADAGR